MEKVWLNIMRIVCVCVCVCVCMHIDIYTYAYFDAFMHKLTLIHTHIKTCCSIVKLCLILCDPMDCSLPGSSAYGVLQARILECVAVSFSRASSWIRGQTYISFIDRQFCTTEPPGKPKEKLALNNI